MESAELHARQGACTPRFALGKGFAALVLWGLGSRGQGSGDGCSGFMGQCSGSAAAHGFSAACGVL
eukprot:874389-Rhodomonas_salina.1